MRATRRRNRASKAGPRRAAPARPFTPATVLVQPDLLHAIAGAVRGAGELETGAL